MLINSLGGGGEVGIYPQKTVLDLPLNIAYPYIFIPFK